MRDLRALPHSSDCAVDATEGRESIRHVFTFAAACSTADRILLNSVLNSRSGTDFRSLAGERPYPPASRTRRQEVLCQQALQSSRRGPPPAALGAGRVHGDAALQLDDLAAVPGGLTPGAGHQDPGRAGPLRAGCRDFAGILTCANAATFRTIRLSAASPHAGRLRTQLRGTFPRKRDVRLGPRPRQPRGEGNARCANPQNGRHRQAEPR
jgi:hypothetical protein